MSPPLVTLHEVDAGYGGTPVLHGLSLRLLKGAHTLVLGPSGCGKTTLLNVIGGLLPVQRGEVHIDEFRLSNQREAARDRFRARHLGCIAQQPQFVRALTLTQNLALAQTLAGVPADPAHIRTLLDDLNLTDKHATRPPQWSQGEAQRVAVARALVNAPLLILADEPTSALDDDHAAAVIDRLHQQADRHGATLLVATHDKRIQAHFANVLRLPQ